MIFSSMQIPDAILWYNKMKKNKVNLYTTSYLIPFLLSLQLVYNNFIRLSNETLDIIVRLMTLYAVYNMFIRYRGYSTASCDSYFSSPVWGGKELEWYILFIFGLLISYPDISRIISVLTALLISQLITNSGYGSLWCAILCCSILSLQILELIIKLNDY